MPEYEPEFSPLLADLATALYVLLVVVAVAVLTVARTEIAGPDLAVGGAVVVTALAAGVAARRSWT